MSTIPSPRKASTRSSNRQCKRTPGDSSTNQEKARKSLKPQLHSQPSLPGETNKPDEDDMHLSLDNTAYVLASYVGRACTEDSIKHQLVIEAAKVIYDHQFKVDVRTAKTPFATTTQYKELEMAVPKLKEQARMTLNTLSAGNTMNVVPPYDNVFQLTEDHLQRVENSLDECIQWSRSDGNNDEMRIRFTTLVPYETPNVPNQVLGLCSLTKTVCQKLHPKENAGLVILVLGLKGSTETDEMEPSSFRSPLAGDNRADVSANDAHPAEIVRLYLCTNIISRWMRSRTQSQPNLQATTGTGQPTCKPCDVHEYQKDCSDMCMLRSYLRNPHQVSCQQSDTSSAKNSSQSDTSSAKNSSNTFEPVKVSRPQTQDSDSINPNADTPPQLISTDNAKTIAKFLRWHVYGHSDIVFAWDGVRLASNTFPADDRGNQRIRACVREGDTVVSTHSKMEDSEIIPTNLCQRLVECASTRPIDPTKPLEHPSKPTLEEVFTRALYNPTAHNTARSTRTSNEDNSKTTKPNDKNEQLESADQHIKQINIGQFVYNIGAPPFNPNAVSKLRWRGHHMPLPNMSRFALAEAIHELFATTDNNDTVTIEYNLHNYAPWGEDDRPNVSQVNVKHVLIATIYYLVVTCKALETQLVSTISKQKPMTPATGQIDDNTIQRTTGSSSKLALGSVLRAFKLANPHSGSPSSQQSSQQNSPSIPTQTKPVLEMATVQLTLTPTYMWYLDLLNTEIVQIQKKTKELYLKEVIMMTEYLCMMLMRGKGTACQELRDRIRSIISMEAIASQTGGEQTTARILSYTSENIDTLLTIPKENQVKNNNSPLQIFTEFLKSYCGMSSTFGPENVQRNVRNSIWLDGVGPILQGAMYNVIINGAHGALPRMCEIGNKAAITDSNEAENVASREYTPTESEEVQDVTNGALEYVLVVLDSGRNNLDMSTVRQRIKAQVQSNLSRAISLLITDGFSFQSQQCYLHLAYDPVTHERTKMLKIKTTRQRNSQFILENECRHAVKVFADKNQGVVTKHATTPARTGPNKTESTESNKKITLKQRSNVYTFIMRVEDQIGFTVHPPKILDINGTFSEVYVKVLMATQNVPQLSRSLNWKFVQDFSVWVEYFATETVDGEELKEILSTKTATNRGRRTAPKSNTLTWTSRPLPNVTWHPQAYLAWVRRAE